MPPALSVRLGFNVTNALGTSPHLSSGIAITAASSTSGWLTTACSTSMVEMFALHDDVAAHHHLAQRLATGRHVAHMLVDDAHFAGQQVGHPLASPQSRLLGRSSPDSFERRLSPSDKRLQ